jgi:hypothetical protein
VRHGIAATTDGVDAHDRVSLSFDTWAKILSGSVAFSDSLASMDVVVTGSAKAVVTTLSAFESQGLRS